MNSTVVYVKHALVEQSRIVAEFKNMSIADLDPGWDRAYIAILDGVAILREDWASTYIAEDKILIFIDAEAIPQGGGGGGSNPLNTILMLAVVVASIYTGGAAGAAIFGAYNGYAAAGILVAGSMLVNAIAPPATTSISNNATNNSSASPTYSIQAQGNSARVEGAIPEHFGRHMFYPDLAAQPYQEFHNNEQYVYILLCLGRGYHYIENIFIEDSPIDNFEEVNLEVIDPYGYTNLFPGNVTTSVEVVGQELETGNTIGGFVANPAGTVTTTIGLDFIATQGLFYAKDDGSLSAVSVKVQPEARLIDDEGNPLGAWFFLGPLTWVPDRTARSNRLFVDASDGETLFNRSTGRVTAVETGAWEDYHIYSAATATPQRYSEKYVVPSGRYEVRVTRLDTKQTDTRYGHTFTWAGLRAYSPDDRTYGDVTIVGIRMQATSQLSGLSSRKIKVISTRKLPIWDGSYWSAPTATTSIAWAYTYICKQYGLTDSQIDLSNVLSLNSVWASRGDECNGRIDSFISFWDAITKVLSAGRAKPYMQAGVVRVFRDQPATIPVAMFSMRNIVKNSLTVDYLMPTTDTADAVDVGYFDRVTWSDKRVRATLPGSTAEKPAKIETSFVTSRSQAYREGMYQAGCNRYRRKSVKFKTEMEGFIPSFGDLIVIQHDMPAWGQAGEVVAWDGDRTITLSEPRLEWGSGNHYVGLRRLDGTIFGPTLVTLGSAANKLVLGQAPDFTVNVGGVGERTHYSFGWGETWGLKARVLSVKPSGLYSVDIEAINEDSNVHTAETGTVTPVAPTSQLITKSLSPTVVGLTSTSMPGDSSVMLLAWQPSAYADHYVIEVSNGGGGWTRVGETRTANYTVKAIFGVNTVVRVAAVGLKQGPWVTVSYRSNVASSWHTTLSGFKAIVSGSGIDISWDTNLDWNIASYEVRYGATWNTAATIVSKYTANSLTWQPTLTGSLTFWLKAIDRYGVYSIEAASYILAVSSAKVSSVAAQVIDNNVLLSWTSTKGTFPILNYEIRRGATFETSVLLGVSSSTFIVIFEETSASYTYWVVPVDTSGLRGVASSITAEVRQPPDYVLHDIQDLQFTGDLENCLLDSGKITLPVNTTETFADHFINNSFTSPQDQIASGLPYFLQPSVPSASYTEIIDYEATIPSMILSIDVDSSLICGTVDISPTLAYSLDGTTWVEAENTYKTLAINFRYVKVSLNVNSLNSGIIVINKVTVRLDAKLKTSQGIATVLSTDVGGTLIDISGENFIDIRSIVLTPMATTAVYAVYDFVDTPNPTQFKIYMFNVSGARISGAVSWTIRGVV